MNLLKYNEYITESKAYELLLESKLIFSKKFVNILSQMRGNKVATELLNIYGKDVDSIRNNYIEVTDQKDTVSFIPDAKAQELIKDKEEIWVVGTRRQLTHNDSNNNIFDKLGYDKTQEYWTPNDGTKGLILSETVSEESGKIFVLFKDYNSDKKAVLNKTSLSQVEDDDVRVWTNSRNNIKVGRLARAILSVAKVTFNDKDIEDFTNQYKATYDVVADVLRQFDIVSGNDIAYWYYYVRYVNGYGTLNNSCMAEVDSEYLEIYTSNPQCNLVILYADNGEITDGKYKSSRIKGRALLWTGKLDGEDAKLMDRIYTVHDSDVELFKQFAEKNGWWYKRDQNMYPETRLTDGTTVKKATFVVHLEDAFFEYYPYMDTMCFLSTENTTLTNNEESEWDRVCRSAEGEYYEEYD